MSLQIGKIKSGASKLASGTSSIQGKLIATGFGALVGAAVNLLLAAIFTLVVYPMTDKKDANGNYIDPVGMHTLYIDNFSIYPYQNVAGHYYMYYDQLIEVLTSIALLITKKWYFVIGYTVGWYASGYFGLYRMLKLPLGAREVPYPVAAT